MVSHLFCLAIGLRSQRNITRRDTLKEDHPEKENQNLPEMANSIGTTLNAARNSKSILTWHITNHLFNTAIVLRSTTPSKTICMMTLNMEQQPHIWDLKILVGLLHEEDLGRLGSELSYKKRNIEYWLLKLFTYCCSCDTPLPIAYWHCGTGVQFHSYKRYYLVFSCAKNYIFQYATQQMEKLGEGSYAQKGCLKQSGKK